MAITKPDINPRVAWVWLALFVGVVAALGGSSRPDVVQISALRPLAAMFLIPALYYLRLEHLRDAKVLAILLGLLGIWMAIQLAPLPPSIWHSLPGRSIIAELDARIGPGDSWRPISWIPSRGWNALASMVVPATSLLIALSMRASPRMLLVCIAGLGVADAILDLLQAIGGRSSPLFFYSVTNRGSPVGIFANENHSAVFSAIALLVIARLAATAKKEKEPVWQRLSYPPSFLVVLLAALISGSRAGLVTATTAVLASVAIVWLSFSGTRGQERRGGIERWLADHPRTLLVCFVGVIAILFGSFFSLERAPGLEDVLAKNAFDDLRWQLWPTIEQMLGTHWLVGIGFGSFEEVYHIYEMNSLLLPSYVNQAHNDWAQLVVEGGLPTAILMIALLVWAASSLFALLRHGDSQLTSLTFWGATFAILCAASLVDYPLRTPIFQLVGVWLLWALAQESAKTVRFRQKAETDD